jgi:hypothetical protein
MATILKPSKGQTVKHTKSGTLTTRPLKNVKYTGKLMRELSVRYANDVSMFAHLSIIEFYDMVKNIPYKEDPKKVEFLQRPYYTLNQRGKGGDCDDKCIVMGAYLALAGIPFRFVAYGKKADGRLHHVIVEALITNDNNTQGKWVHLDPTYSYNTIGVPLHQYQKRLVISDIYPNSAGEK